MQKTTFKKPSNRKPASSTNRSQNGGFKKRYTSRAPKSSNLDPNLLVKAASQSEAVDFRSNIEFDSLPISDALKRSIKAKGFTRPTEIQDKTIKDLLAGRDLLGIAQTGSGKTGAFLITIIENLLSNKRKSYALIMVPTRELATQVEDEFRSLTKGLGLFSACFIGGTNINTDIKNLHRGSHVIIGTPGRLLDLSNRGELRLNSFNTLVLDEFDRMLDMGFVHDVKNIIGKMTTRKHNMLFSATLDKTQKSIIGEILVDPVTVQVSSGQTTGDNIEQNIIRLKDGEDKFVVLQNMLETEEFEKVILFEETKHKVKRLCEKLNQAGIKSDQIHGNKSQNARQNALNAFKRGQVQVLVATDVAARGIDVTDVTHVINYQIPMTFDSYIHRIGRTGRAGKTGKAITFV
jgi:ATP-dependent RNA helicase RhlE